MSVNAASLLPFPQLTTAAVRRAWSTARAVGFWLAVTLPFVYLPLTIPAPGIVADPTVIGAAIAGNLLALVVGHGHDPSA